MTMTRKLIFTIIASALLAAALAAVGRLVFPDINAFMPGEDENVSWLREIAFMVRATAWISAEVSGLFAIALAAYLWRKRAPKTPSKFQA